jgi:hypothetical protein
MFIDETSTFCSNELQGSELRRPALPSRQAMVGSYRTLQNDGDACYPYPCYLPRLMMETAAPRSLQQPIWWCFAVSIAWAVTLLLVAVGITDVWATLKG